jgi:glutamine synthetase adenylyltransferase
VVQMGLLLNANKFPQLIRSTDVTEQLLALHNCGWINTHVFNTLEDAYTQISHARQHSALVDDAADLQTTALLNIAQALCEDILS